MTIKIADLTTELSVTSRDVELFVDELVSVDGFDATYADEQGHTLTDAAADAVREAFKDGVPQQAWVTRPEPGVDELLLAVKRAADDYRAANEVATAARERRDEAIKAAVARGLNRTSIASTAFIRRERLYQILDEAKAK